MRILHITLVAVTRLLLSGYFIISSLIKIFSWGIEERQLFEAMTIWEPLVPQNNLAYTLFVELLQAPTILIGLSFGTYLVLGVLFLLGVRQLLCAGLLSCALLISAFLFHPFWVYDGERFDTELLAFATNAVMMGGLLTHALWSAQRGGEHTPTYGQGALNMRLREDD